MLSWLLYGIALWLGLIVFASCALGVLSIAVCYLNRYQSRVRKDKGES